MRQRIKYVAVFLICSLAAPATANPAGTSSGSRSASPYMRIYGPTLPPYGFVRFCETHARECVSGNPEEVRFSADDDRMAELDRLNRHVNKIIRPATDLELYGEVERWTIPGNAGDCEDYALLKRQLLMARGWPASSLLITVVLDEKNEGHAVLTARTAQGDFVLDNKVNDIRPWHKVRYTFVSRQSYIDPMVWVALDNKDGRPPALLAGVKSPKRR